MAVRCSRGLRPFVVAAVAMLALAFSGSALALDHVVITTHDVTLAPRVVKKGPPVCKKGQKSKSTKKHPCAKARSKQAASATQNPPDPGWQFGLQLAGNPDGTWGLKASLTRTTGNVVEAHYYSFTLNSASVSVSPDLTSATLDTGTQLGEFGSMKLTFSNPGAFAPATPAFGCTTGNWQMRTGAMTGAVRFVADQTYFQTIVQTSLPTDVSANTGAPPTCGQPVPGTCGHDSQLAATTTSSGPYLYASNRAGVGSLFEFVTEKIGPASIAHALTEGNLPDGDLTFAPDFSSAKATTAGSARFTGSLSFTASTPPVATPYPACGAGATYSVAKGTTTGGIVGHFAAIPPPVPALGPSFLSKQ